MFQTAQCLSLCVCVYSLVQPLWDISSFEFAPRLSNNIYYILVGIVDTTQQE